MTISSEHFSTIAFLGELHTQCNLFKRSYNKLQIAAEHWRKLSEGTNDGNSASPLDIIAECTVCLSVMSAISRILTSNKTPIENKRSNGLMLLLDEPNLDNLITKKVRNHWEHHDERMDKLLSNMKVGHGLSRIHVKVTPPKETCFVLKRFDPVNLTIHFLNDTIELPACLDEINDLSTRLNKALAKLDSHS